ARLLDLLIKIDCQFIRQSHIAEVENHYGVKEGGLLDFAASRMVEFEDDILMHMTLIDFFAELLNPDHSLVESTEAIQFLDQRGLHYRTLSYYIEPSKHSSLDQTYLYSRSANYVATYASFHPSHFLNSPCILLKTLARLTDVLSDISPHRWAHGPTPKHDLHVLASLPRLALLPGRTEMSPLFFLETKPANEDTLHTLATVFHGTSTSTLECSTARALYYLYLEQNPDMWQDVVKAAETIALKEAALASIALINAVITANWTALPDPSRPNLPTEKQLAEKCGSHQTLAPTGILAIFTPPALSTVIPYLLRPGQTFSNLVGGGKGDVESAAYRVAAAKHDVLLSLKPRLQEVAQESSQFQDVLAVINKRLALGVLGGNSDVGSSIGTLES
ncbi:MAG: hypothetical protein Q9183_002283, partial [Haloplaca sp. 2 TL-2023]